MTKTEAVEAYETKSAAFTELNKQYNRGLRNGDVTDALELQFLRAERELKSDYAALAAMGE